MVMQTRLSVAIKALAPHWAKGKAISRREISSVADGNITLRQNRNTANPDMMSLAAAVTTLYLYLYTKPTQDAIAPRSGSFFGAWL